MLLTEAINGYWLEKRIKVSPHTVRDYTLTFNRLVLFLGRTYTIEAVTADDIRHFLEYCSNEFGLKAKTIINIWIALSSLWSWAHNELSLPQIVHKIERPRWRAPAIVPYRRDEIAALLYACDYNSPWKTRTGKIAKPMKRPSAVRDRAIILTLLDTGLRASEFCDLRLADLTSATGRLHVEHGKGDKKRDVFMGDAAHRAVWRYLNTRPGIKPDAPLFAARNNRPLDRDGLRHMLDCCGVRAGVENVHPHRFRHTFAIWFLRNGGSVLELQSALGHESMETVRIYVRLAEIDLQNAQRRASPADNWRL